MRKAITFMEYPYSRMCMVDLLDETEEIKWKILDYHNQDFVLKNIVNGRPFNAEGHAEFLKALPTLKRKQYILYLDGRDIGKLSWTPDDSGKILTDAGYFLFHEEDLMSGIGALMAGFLHHYVFDVLKIEKMESHANLFNTNSIGITKRFGSRVVRQDERFMYFEITAADYYKQSAEIDSLLCSFLSHIIKEKHAI